MLGISVLDTPNHRRLVVVGKLIAPWVAELRRAWRNAEAGLNGRELVIRTRSAAGLKASPSHSQQFLRDRSRTSRHKSIRPINGPEPGVMS